MCCNIVGDDFDVLVVILCECSEQVDVLIVNGGFGLISDDLSVLVVVIVKGEGFILYLEWLEIMICFFVECGRLMVESNCKQVEILVSVEMINNLVGMVCGFVIQFNCCLMFFIFGVFFEFKVMVEQEILLCLCQCFMLLDLLVCLCLIIFGCLESELV